LAEKALRFCLLAGFWLPLAVCTYLALTPSPPEAVFGIGDFVPHAFAFTYLTFALGLAHPPVRALVPGLWMLGYGLLLEVVQSFEASRSAEVKDLAVDLLGICLGLLAARWLAESTRRRLFEALRWMLPDEP
jgi:VanZ family protein